MTWEWEQPDPNRAGAAGSLAGLFVGARIQNPGVLGHNPPDNRASLLAREAIQNSWDAAHERAKADARPVKMSLEFRFKEHVGKEKEMLIEALGLDELQSRVTSAGGWRKVGLATEDSLTRAIAKDEPLTMLEVHERHTTGMYGAWKFDESRMYLGLITVGYTEKADGSGGSFGYGKAGLLGASAPRNVFTYTCFRELQSDPGVTRRFLGMSYWKRHKVGDQSFTGFGRMGNGLRPWENDDADKYATQLGLEIREPSQEDDLGTSFLLLEPLVEPNDLLRAIERWWWPALIRSGDDFDVSVVDVDGSVHHPRPKSVAELRSFIEAFELAASGGQGGNENTRFHKFDSLALPNDGNLNVEVGALALVADPRPEGWTWIEDDEVDHNSLIALTRGPGMVIDYHRVMTVPRPAHVRGVFVADASEQGIDDLLRQTEPPAHNTLIEDPSALLDGTHPDAALCAQTVLSRIRLHVDRFRSALRPPAPDRGRYRLVELDRLFRKLFGDGDEPPPPPKGELREVSIQVPVERPIQAPDNPELIRCEAVLRFALTENVPKTTETARAEVTIQYRFVEDDRTGSAEESHCKLTFNSVPEGFALVPGRSDTYRGEVARQPVEFRVTSTSYDPDYVGRLIASAELLPEAASEHDNA